MGGGGGGGGGGDQNYSIFVIIYLCYLIEGLAIPALPITELRIDLKDKWEFTAVYNKAQMHYEPREDSYNILLIGPTGIHLHSPLPSLSHKAYVSS